MKHAQERPVAALPGLSLRPARMEDITALTRLIERSARQLNARDYSPSQIESSLRYLFGVNAALIRSGTYFVAQMDGRQIVGCGGWSHRRALCGHDQTAEPGSVDDLLDPATEAARIRAIFVHPDWTRCGIGSALLTVSEEAAWQAGYRRLELVATHTGMPLYRVSGYRIVEPVRVVLPDGEVLTGTRMTKTFA